MVMKITMTQSVIEPSTFLRLAVPQPTTPLCNPQTQAQSRNKDHALSTMETCMATGRYTDVRTDKYILCSGGIKRTPTRKVACKIRTVTDTHKKNVYMEHFTCVRRENQHGERTGSDCAVQQTTPTLPRRVNLREPVNPALFRSAGDEASENC